MFLDKEGNKIPEDQNEATRIAVENAKLTHSQWEAIIQMMGLRSLTSEGIGKIPKASGVGYTHQRK